MRTMCKRNRFDISAWCSLHQIIQQIDKHKEDIEFRIVFLIFVHCFFEIRHVYLYFQEVKCTKINHRHIRKQSTRQLHRLVSGIFE